MVIVYYWFYNDMLEIIISLIIFYDDSVEEVLMKLKKMFLVKMIKLIGNRFKLSQNEYSLFLFFFNGWLLKKIVYWNGISVKNIYVMKNCIECKLGVFIIWFVSQCKIDNMFC